MHEVLGLILSTTSGGGEISVFGKPISTVFLRVRLFFELVILLSTVSIPYSVLLIESLNLHEGDSIIPILQINKLMLSKIRGECV